MMGHHARLYNLCELNSKTIKDYEYNTWYATKYFLDFQRRFSAYCAKNGNQPTHPAPVASPVILSFASWFAPQLNSDARKKSCSNCLENFCCLYELLGKGRNYSHFLHQIEEFFSNLLFCKVFLFYQLESQWLLWSPRTYCFYSFHSYIQQIFLLLYYFIILM